MPSLALISTSLFAAVATTATLAQPPESITMTIDPTAMRDDYSGRLYLVAVPADTQEQGDPLSRMHGWFDRVPVAAWDVEDLEAGTPATLSGWDLIEMSENYREQWGQGEWIVQAVARVNPDASNAGRGQGDLYSEPVLVSFDEPADFPSLTLTEVVEERPFEESSRLKLFRMHSSLLSEFHGRPISVNAAVYLPESWSPEKEHPILYVVTGFGGSHHDLLRYYGFMGGAQNAGDTIVVMPDATNFYGHSVFANSAVIGPWGDALVHELAPAIEAVYSGPSDPEHRYVTGVSSGGWSSLWLQLEYPTEFGGAWSHVPDPVDFRAFQTVDILAPDANIYTDENGDRRPIGRRGNEIALYADDFINRETVMGPGGQIESFEGVFSPRDADGTPQQLFDRETGEISSATAAAWEPYDIRAKIAKEWDDKRDSLRGKLRVYGGEMDNFYLGESVELLVEQMQELGVELGSMDDEGTISEADVRLIPGLPHTLYQPGNAAMWRTIKERWNARGE